MDSSLASMGSKGSGDNQFSHLCGIGISPSDQIFVIEDGKHLIQIFE
jgi:hypothetical protein